MTTDEIAAAIAAIIDKALRKELKPGFIDPDSLTIYRIVAASCPTPRSSAAGR